jgi:hypothetical protein
MKKNIGVMILSFFLFITQLASNLAHADQVTDSENCGLAEPECVVIKGLLKLFPLLTEFQKAFSQFIAPIERAQFIRGLGRLEGDIARMLATKRKILNAITDNRIELEAMRRLSQDETPYALSSLAFLDPQNFPQSYKIRINSTQPGKLHTLRQDYYEMRRLMELVAEGKNTARLLLLDEARNNIPFIRQKLIESESTLVRAQTVVRQTLDVVDQ